MKRLLLVEDDAGLGETLCERLAKEPYQVTWARTLSEATRHALAPWPREAGGAGPGGEAQGGRPTDFDLIILDVNLPDGSGFDFARKVRSARAIPFVFITALNSAEHRLEGYEIGADEFIPKPFHLKELLLRIRHVLNTHAEISRIRIGAKTIDLAARAIIGPNGAKEFPAERDFQLLKILIETAPRALSRDEILDLVWGEDKYPSHRTVDNAIVRLRASLGDSDGQVIRSVRGVGYQWVGQE